MKPVFLFRCHALLGFMVERARALALSGLLILPAGSAPGDLAQRVVILANASDPDSLRIARHYAEQRAVPEANIIALKLPLAETITWPEFVAAIWQPLQDE